MWRQWIAGYTTYPHFRFDTAGVQAITLAFRDNTLYALSCVQGLKSQRVLMFQTRHAIQELWDSIFFLHSRLSSCASMATPEGTHQRRVKRP